LILLQTVCQYFSYRKIKTKTMRDLAQRFPKNPLLLPKDLKASSEGMQIISLLNPGVFTYDQKVWLIVRVAESIIQKEGFVYVPVINIDGVAEHVEVLLNDPDLIATDARVINYKGLDYLTTISHLRLLSSIDGVHFEESPSYPPLFGEGTLERFGIEDCRVAKIAEDYYLSYTAVSESGVGVGVRHTQDWQNFKAIGMVLPPHNKDCAIFEEKINGKYYALHRPSSVELGGNYIWLAESPDLVHWGNHKCIVKTRGEMWDSARVGAGAAPIKTDQGWLSVYHGANDIHQYCLGAFLMDLHDPSRVIGRTGEPIMIPIANYELSGFFGHVVFTNGHVIAGDKLTIYYGAADEFVCAANFSIQEILSALTRV
jgi:predicted GH43/DUF377 family glycosyl hydrolase